MTIFVVTGPPAGGKSTWVEKRAMPGSIIIDYDRLFDALVDTGTQGFGTDPTEHPARAVAVVQAARAAAMDEAITNHDGINDVYLVHALPDRHALNRYRKHGARIVTIDPGHTECMRRAELERTPRQVALVDDWYRRRGLAVS